MMSHLISLGLACRAAHLIETNTTGHIVIVFDVPKSPINQQDTGLQ